MQVRTRNTSRDSSPGQDLARTQSMNIVLHRTESDITMFSRPAKQPLSRYFRMNFGSLGFQVGGLIWFG